MASLPIMLNLLDELDFHPNHFGNDFGSEIYCENNDHCYRPRQDSKSIWPYQTLTHNLIQRWNERGARRRNDQLWCTNGDEIKKLSAIGKNGFQVCLDVQQFKPNELIVKVVDNHIVVEGTHEEREDDHGFISRKFVRRYLIPKDYDADKVVSSLSSDGVLSVNIPKPRKMEDNAKVRVVQIQQTGPAHLNVRENAQEKEETKRNVSTATNGGDINGPKSEKTK